MTESGSEDPDETPAPDEEVPGSGPNTLCTTCGGFKRISQPRLYVFQATEDITTGTTLNSWTFCPHCKGKGYLPGIVPPA